MVGRRSIPWVRFLVAAGCTLISTRDSLAETYCQDLEFHPAIVAEARHTVLSGTDTAYVNMYWDSGEELSLDRYVGGLFWTDYVRFGFHVYSRDGTASDCAVVTFQMNLRRSNEQSNLCPSAYLQDSVTYVTDSCSGGDADTLYAGTTMVSSSYIYRRWWYASMAVDAPEANPTPNPDTGCFELLRDDDCELVDFPHFVD